MKTVACILSLFFVNLGGCGDGGNNAHRQPGEPVERSDMSELRKDLDDKSNQFTTRQDYARLLALCNEYIARDPGYARAYVARSLAYSATNEVDRATADRIKALELLPRDEKVYRRELLDSLALTHMNQVKFDKAIEFCDALIAINPTDDYGYRLKSICQSQTRDFDGALVTINRAVDLHPESPACYSIRAKIWEMKGNRENATRDQNRAADLQKSQ
jgi:tetratricopeptide (TPR) repeat protein